MGYWDVTFSEWTTGTGGRYLETRLPPLPLHPLQGEPLKEKLSRFGIRLESGTIGRRVKKVSLSVSLLNYRFYVLYYVIEV